VIDCLHYQIAEAAYKPGEIKDLVGEELYSQIFDMIDEQELAEWGIHRKSPLLDACIAVTSNCMGDKHDC
jgi:hypothetical protein